MKDLLTTHPAGRGEIAPGARVRAQAAARTAFYGAVFGWDLLIRLGAFVGVAVLAMAIHMFVVYPLVVWIGGGMSPLSRAIATEAALSPSHGRRPVSVSYSTIPSENTSLAGPGCSPRATSGAK